MRVFITGATGLVGAHLTQSLFGLGDEVIVLSRRPDAWQSCGANCTIVQGDPTQPGDWQQAAVQCDAVVNLAGANVMGGRWTKAYRETLRSSRVRSTQNVVEALARSPLRSNGQPKVLINASAIGYYGPHDADELTEASPPGTGFLPDLCREWEAAALAGEQHGLRVALPRIGLVLGRGGGALGSMVPLFRAWLGGPFGSGRQWWSWVHIDDLARMINFALNEADVTGAFNATAPAPVRNFDFCDTLGRALTRPCWLTAPTFALWLILGQRARTLTEGARVIPRRMQEWQFPFRFPYLSAALADLYPGGRLVPAVPPTKA
jgi:hypothetical protein